MNSWQCGWFIMRMIFFPKDTGSLADFPQRSWLTNHCLGLLLSLQIILQTFWTKTVCHSDSRPELFLKNSIFEKKNQYISDNKRWKKARPRSAVGNVSGYRCVSDCNSRGREFDPGPVPYFRGDWSWNNFYGHSPPFCWFIQEGLLSVTSESMCTNYWLSACSSLPRKKCG